MPRRRRGARAVAAEAETERGLAMRILLYSPKDMIAGLLAFTAVSAIITNALFLQTGRHPSPMFGSVVVMPPPAAVSSPLPRPRPVEATRAAEAPAVEPKPVELKSIEPKAAEPRSVELKSVETKAAEPKSVEPKTFEPKSVEPKAVEQRPVEPKNADPLANLVKATTTAPPPTSSPILRPPASIPVPATASSGARRVAAVQRALTEYGYGQLKPTGTVGSDTRAAIQKFERQRKLPVTGQVSDRLVHELAVMIGRPVE